MLLNQLLLKISVQNKCFPKRLLLQTAASQTQSLPKQMLSKTTASPNDCFSKDVQLQMHMSATALKLHLTAMKFAFFKCQYSAVLESSAQI